MSQPLILSLPGGAALSAFRIEKIRAQMQEAGLAPCRIATQYWHFLELEAALTRDEEAVPPRRSIMPMPPRQSLMRSFSW